MGYKIFLALHVLSAIVWVGGAIWVEMLVGRAQKSNNPAYLGGLGADVTWAGKTVFPGASIATLVFGIGTVITGKFGFEQPWILIGLVIIAITLVLGMGILGPTSKKMAAIAAEKGMGDPEAQKLMHRIRTVSHIDTVLLILAVLDMTIKPFT